MPAKSQQQQKFFGLVHAMQKGEVPKKGNAGKTADTITKKAATDYASTTTKGLPKKVTKEGDYKHANTVLHIILSRDSISTWMPVARKFGGYLHSDSQGDYKPIRKLNGKLVWQFDFEDSAMMHNFINKYRTKTKMWVPAESAEDFKSVVREIVAEMENENLVRLQQAPMFCKCGHMSSVHNQEGTDSSCKSCDCQQFEPAGTLMGEMEKTRPLSVAEKHQLAVAKATLKMNPSMAGVMGGPSRQQAIQIIKKLTGVDYSTKESVEDFKH